VVVKFWRTNEKYRVVLLLDSLLEPFSFNFRALFLSLLLSLLLLVCVLLIFGG
jgi:hypothetical protein